VPVKPFRYVTVMVEVTEAPELTAAGEAAVMSKSVTVNVTVVE